MRFSFLFLLLAPFACRHKVDVKKHIADPRAKKLVDSAVVIGSQNYQYKKAISLLDQAIEIDRNYAAPYNYKLSYQWQLREYDSALATAHTLIQITPEVPDYYVQIGLLYDQIGDTVSSKKFYEVGILKYDRILDTMNLKNKTYNYFLFNKAMDLAFLRRQEESNKLFKELSDNQSNQFLKDYYNSFINKSKNEILKLLESNDSASTEMAIPN